MSLPTPTLSFSHKRFYLCVNHKKKLSLWHLLPVFYSFSFFKESLWLVVDKVLQKLKKSYKSDIRLLFQCCILIPSKCPRKTPFQNTLPPSLLQQRMKYIIYEWSLKKTLSDIEDAGGCKGKGKNVCPRTGQACGGGSTSSSGKLYTVK